MSGFGRLISLRYNTCLEQSLGLSILPPPLFPFKHIWYSLLIICIGLVWELQWIVVILTLTFFCNYLNAYLISNDFPQPSDPTTTKGVPSLIQGFNIDRLFWNIGVDIAIGSFINSDKINSSLFK